MTPKRLRILSLLIGLACSAAALVTWSQTWYSVTLTGQFAAHPRLEVGGADVAPAIAALALASAMGFAAMAIAGPFFRVLLALLQVVVGASIAFSASLANSTPVAAVSAAVTQATGLEGSRTVSALIGSIVPTIWPSTSLGVGIVLAVVGIGILLTGRLWPRSSRRYDAVRLEPEPTKHVRDEPPTGFEAESGDAAISNWDELSGGVDPTTG